MKQWQQTLNDVQVDNEANRHRFSIAQVRFNNHPRETSDETETYVKKTVVVSAYPGRGSFWVILSSSTHLSAQKEFLLLLDILLANVAFLMPQYP